MSLPKGSWGYLLALAAIILLPILLRPAGESALLEQADERLVIISPHNEATRYEFARAFTAYYREKSGRTVAIDWRTPGGASEIARTLASGYASAFRLHWERTLGRRWSGRVEAAFADPWVTPDARGEEGAQAREAFLQSQVGVGIDVYFGGGSYEFIQQSRTGCLVPGDILSRYPELFGPGGSIPALARGEALYDPEGRWVGAARAAFGICYQDDALRRLGVEHPPAAWHDLANPRFSGQTALADPTQSGSAAKAFEMVLQQEIAATGRKGAAVDPAAGWANGLRLIRRIAANARYFTDAASKVPWDVAAGDAAAGMAIDFYGRSQSEAVARPDGTSRMHYFTPPDGSSYGSDPIGLLRGAPSPELAQEFIGFVLSQEGQKLWNWKRGTPGGPVRYALRRLPLRPDLYAPEYAAFRSDPDVNPYAAGGLEYHPEWTGRLFRAIGFCIQAACITPHPELREAWSALIAAGFPPEATARFDAIDGITYTEAMEVIRPALGPGDRIAQVRLAKKLGDRFRKQYQEAAALAREGR